MEPVWEDERVRRGMVTQLRAREERVAAGAAPLGWKIGFGVPAQYEARGLGGPLVGFLVQTAFSRGEPVDVSGWTRPVLEPELAVHLGRDVPGGSDRATVAAAIAAVGPAIELADVDPAVTDVEQVVAGNVFHRDVLLGDPDPARAGADVSGVALHLLRDGEEVARVDDPVAAAGDPVEQTRHVADLLAACGATLRAGEVVITGAIVPGVVAAAEQEWRCDLGALGALTARLTAS